MMFKVHEPTTLSMIRRLESRDWTGQCVLFWCVLTRLGRETRFTQSQRNEAGTFLDADLRRRRSIGFAVDELIKLNHQTDVHVLEEGTTLLLPAEKLSKRDREILAGIGSKYRTYPVRQGESIADIVTKRGITMEELVELNPDIELQGDQGEQEHLE